MTWPTIKLGECLTKAATWNPHNSDVKEFTYVDLSAVDQAKKEIIKEQKVNAHEAPSRARQIIEENDVLVSTVRPNLNGVCKVSSRFHLATASTGFCVLRSKDNILNHNYLFNWVKNINFVNDMVSKATGASYPAVSDRIIYDSLIPLPPLAEQQRIAAILDKAEEIKRKREQAIAKLDELAQSTFIEMFGDPSINPKKWSKVTLGDLIHSASDGPHVSPQYTDTGIPFLSARHVRPSTIAWRDLKFLSLEDAKSQWKKCKPMRGDILYTKGGTTGYAAVVKTDDDFAIWVHIALLKPNLQRVKSVWLEHMLNSQYCYQQSQKYTHGIANRDLGLKRMVKIDMYQPPLALQEEFVNRINKLMRIKDSNLLATDKHQPVSASLQHQAFTTGFNA